MTEALAKARERGQRAAIICLDLDRFKQVNDWYGHAAGDVCLKQMATMLTRRLRGMDTVARTGGEEFTIVLGEVESVASAQIVALRNGSGACRVIGMPPIAFLHTVLSTFTVSLGSGSICQVS